MSDRLTINISGEYVLGMSIRLLFLGTHYRKPLDYTEQRLKESEKIWRRWVNKAENLHGVVPLEFLQALCDDMNTPKAISLLHGYYKNKQYGMLFEGMKLLGLIPNIKASSISDMEQKTVPPEQEAMLEARQSIQH